MRGFASSRRGRIVNVWLYRKNANGIELNIENVGAEGHFYGRPGEGDLDERITKLETDFAPLVESLRGFASEGHSLVEDERIPHLVAHLTFRTRHLRESMAELMKSFTTATLQHMTDREVARAFCARELSREGALRDVLKLALLQHGVENLEEALGHLEPYTLQIADNIMEMLGDNYQKVIDETRAQYDDMTPEAFRAGFIDSLSRNLPMPERTKAYSELCWHVRQSPSPIILGDSVCVFETNTERRFRPIDVETDQLLRVYLPLSSQAVLVGTRPRLQPNVDVRLLNKAVARCSNEFFLSSCELPKDSHLVKGLGLWAGLLGDREFGDLLKETFPKLLK